MLSQHVINPLKAIPTLIRSRQEGIIVWSWSVAMSLLIAGNGFPPLRPSFLIVLSMIFISASVYLYNDTQDIDMDSENNIKKNRPIPSKKVTKDTVLKIVYFFGFIGLSLAYIVSIYSFVFALIYYILFFFYSYPSIKLKNRFLGKDLTLFVASPLCGLMANYAVSNTFSPLTFISSTLVGILVLTGGPILNESSDLLEDTKYGVKSFSTLLTWKRKIQLMILGILLLSTLMPIIQLLFGVHLIVPIISVGLNIVLLRFLFPVMGQYEETRVNKARKIAKLIFFFIPISFIIVSL